MSVTILAHHRAADGRFAKGHSGNPTGRPKGARNRATVLAEQLRDAGPELLADATRRALGGDAVTLRSLLHYLLPKPGDATVDLGLAPGAERNAEAVFDATVRAVADGVISPADALRIGRLVALRARVAERAARLRLRATKSARPPSGLHSPAESRSKRPRPNPSPRARAGGEQPRSAAACREGFGTGISAPQPLALAPRPRAVPVPDLYFPSYSMHRPRAALRASTALGDGRLRLSQSPAI
jgi:hypothetical protein